MAPFTDIPDPAGYHRAASELRQRAEDLAHYTQRIDGAVQRTIFEGPAASQMRELMSHQKTELARIVSELQSLATMLSRAAGAYEDQISSRPG